MRVGLIINRRSRRNRSKSWPAAALADPRLSVAALDEFGELPDAVSRMMQQDVGVLAISGGDGTIQAVLTELGNAGALAKPPVLAVLAGGTTNMIAGDVGLRGRPEQALARLLSLAGTPELLRASVPRHVICVDYRPDGRPLYGLFFGTAGICRAIVFCRDTAEAAGITAGPASVFTLAGIFGRRLLRRGGQDDIIRGDPMTVRFDGGPPQPGSRLLALVTTLDRLVLRSRPYWGRGEGALRYTEVMNVPPRLLRAVYPFLYRGGRGLPCSDYRSRTADRIAFEMTCPFTLDGELYEPAPGVPVELSRAGLVRFVR